MKLFSAKKKYRFILFSLFIFFTGLIYSDGIVSITNVEAFIAPGYCCFVEVKITDVQKDEEGELSFGFVIRREVDFDKFLKHSIYTYTIRDFGLCIFNGNECVVNKGEVYESRTISHRKDRYWMLESISVGDRVILLARKFCGMDSPCSIGFGPAAPIKSEPKGMMFWLISGSITVLLLGAGAYIIRRLSFKKRS